MDKLAQEWHDAVDECILMARLSRLPLPWTADDSVALQNARTHLLEATRALIMEGMFAAETFMEESDGWMPEPPFRKSIATELLPDRPTGDK